MPANGNDKSNLDILEELTTSLLNVSEEVNLYKETLDLLPIGIAIVSSRIISWANKKTLKLFGYTNLSEVVGKNSIVFYASRDECERAGKKCYPNGGSTLSKMKAKNGDVFWMYINVHISNAENGRALVLFCSLDGIQKICEHFGEEMRYL